MRGYFVVLADSFAEHATWFKSSIVQIQKNQWNECNYHKHFK